MWVLLTGFQNDVLYVLTFLLAYFILCLIPPLLPIPRRNSGTWGEFLAHLGNILLHLHQPLGLGRVTFDLSLWGLNLSVCSLLLWQSVRPYVSHFP